MSNQKDQDRALWQTNECNIFKAPQSPNFFWVPQQNEGQSNAAGGVLAKRNQQVTGGTKTVFYVNVSWNCCVVLLPGIHKSFQSVWTKKLQAPPTTSCSPPKAHGDLLLVCIVGCYCWTMAILALFWNGTISANGSRFWWVQGRVSFDFGSVSPVYRF